MRLRASPNWLLLFVPVSIVLEHSQWTSPAVVFFAAALAIVPAARLIVQGTEQIAARTGAAVGGLLNATFGNLPELIIATVALRSGLLDMVRASIIGAILANLLLALGVALLVGWAAAPRPGVQRERGAGLQLDDAPGRHQPGRSGAHSSEYSPPRSIIAEGARHQRSAGVPASRWYTHCTSSSCSVPTASNSRVKRRGATGTRARSRVELPRALGTLIGASVLAAWMSEILVGAAEGTGEASGMSQTFIGMIIVAAVGGGAAESLSAIAAAGKNKLDLTMAVVYGSCIQIALFVAPALVLLSRCHRARSRLDLSFGRTRARGPVPGRAHRGGGRQRRQGQLVQGHPAAGGVYHRRSAPLLRSLVKRVVTSRAAPPLSPAARAPGKFRHVSAGRCGRLRFQQRMRPATEPVHWETRRNGITDQSWRPASRPGQEKEQTPVLTSGCGPSLVLLNSTRGCSRISRC